MINTNSTSKYNLNFTGQKKLSYDLMRDVRMITDVMTEINPNIQNLHKAKRCSGAKIAMQKLKEMLGLQCVYNEGGISISVDNDVIDIISPNPTTLFLKKQSSGKNRHSQHLLLNFDQIVNSAGFNSNIQLIERFVEDITQRLDLPLLQLRKFIRLPEVTEVLQKISPKAVLSSNQQELTDKIISLFIEIRERITSIENGVTRSKIKNGYCNAKPSIHGSKQLEFTSLDSDKNDYSVNIITIAAGQSHLVVKLGKENEPHQVIIIDPKYRVLKEKNLGKVYNLGSNAVYYSQREIDSIMFSYRLEILCRELVKYNEYLKQSIAKLNEYKSNHTTGEIGHLDKKTLTIIDEMMSKFDSCKAKMLKIKDSVRKNKFKKKYGIDTRDGSPSLIFRNFNDNNESVHLSFPTMAGVRCMKIIIEKSNGNIGKSYFVNGDLLVKFNATSLGRSKRTDLNSNYFSQEEIANSGLDVYLTALLKRLRAIE